MATVYTTAASGFAVSSSVLLFPRDPKWSTQVPSMAGNAVRVEFATSSAGSDWGALHMRGDLSDVVASSTVRPTCYRIQRPRGYGVYSSQVFRFAIL